MQSCLYLVQFEAIDLSSYSSYQLLSYQLPSYHLSLYEAVFPQDCPVGVLVLVFVPLGQGDLAQEQPADNLGIISARRRRRIYLLHNSILWNFYKYVDSMVVK